MVTVGATLLIVLFLELGVQADVNMLPGTCAFPEHFNDPPVKDLVRVLVDPVTRVPYFKSTQVNYMTARRTYKVWLDEFGTPVVVTVGAPLFYWLDVNGNGEFETGKGEMWSDPDEDGITGNERTYDTSHLEQQPSRIPQWSAPVP